MAVAYLNYFSINFSVSYLANIDLLMAGAALFVHNYNCMPVSGCLGDESPQIDWKLITRATRLVTNYYQLMMTS